MMNSTVNGGNTNSSIEPVANRTSQNDINNSKQFKYNEEDGFMRGARIAEKIQEFYNHSKMPPATMAH